MTCAVATEEALGIEYDEQTACDVCRDVCEMHVCDCVNLWGRGERLLVGLRNLWNEVWEM